MLNPKTGHLSKKQELVLVAIITVIFIITRILLLVNVEQFIANDEAVVATMALRIFEEGEHPFYIYGLHYGGGGSIGAHITATLFYFFGVSSFIPKFTEILITLLLFFITYLFTRKFFGYKVAILTLALFALSPPLFTRFNLTVFGSYMTTLLFNVLILFIFYNIFFNNKKENIHFILLGITCAVAWWNLEFAILTIILIMFFWYLQDKKLFIKKNFVVFLISFLVSLSPVVIYNITHRLANIKNFFYGSFINKIVCEFHLLPKDIAVCLEDQQFNTSINPLNFIGNHLSSLFSSGKYHKYGIGIFSSLSWVYYGIFLVLFAYVLYLNREGIKSIFKSLLPSSNLNPNNIRREVIILAFFFLFCLSYMVKGISSVKYLLSLYPFVFIIIAIAIIELCKSFRKKNEFAIFIPWLFFLTFLFIGAFQHITLTEAKVVGCDNYYVIKEETPFSVKIDCRGYKDLLDASDIISFLDSQDISRFYSTHFIQWTLIFQSTERIVGACDYLCPCLYLGYVPPYSKMVEESDNFAYLFHKRSTFNDKLINYFESNNITYKIEEIDDINIYYSFPSFVRPKEVMKKQTLIC